MIIPFILTTIYVEWHGINFGESLDGGTFGGGVNGTFQKGVCISHNYVYQKNIYGNWTKC